MSLNENAENAHHPLDQSSPAQVQPAAPDAVSGTEAALNEQNPESEGDSHVILEHVRAYLDRHRIEVTFDGILSLAGAPLRSESPETAGNYLDAEALTASDLVDDIVLERDRLGLKPKAGLVKVAVRKELKRRRKNRYKTILLPLLRKVKDATYEKLADSEWNRVGQLFDMPATLACDSIKHFIWQVKSKSLGRPVVHHLMPVIFSAEQGSGKTTFVRALLGPLRELASADALISDFADHRGGDIYGFPVVVIDDLEKLSKDAVPVLKSLITSERISRRRLNTSQSVSMRQRATLIGTANRPIHELVDDDTGHRRFVMMPFRNGNVAKGGEQGIWEIASSLNYELLWQSVDAYAPTPIIRSLSDLHEYQNRDRPMPKLLEWLCALDPESEKIKRISVQGGVRADKLRDLYVMETGDVLSKQKFSDAMLLHMRDTRTPFFEKHKKEIGALYRIRHQINVRPSVQAEGHDLGSQDWQPSDFSPVSTSFESSEQSASSASSGLSASSSSSGMVTSDDVPLSPAEGDQL
jgi:Virulence-associated protein E